MTIRYTGPRHAGLTEAKAIRGESSALISPCERVALPFARLMAEDHQEIGDTFSAELRRHYSEADIVDLVADITVNLGFGRFNHVVGIDPVRGR